MTESNKTMLKTQEHSVEVNIKVSGGDRWVPNISLLWERRRTLLRVAIVSLLLSAAIAFLIPKQYESTTRVMPPEQQGMGTAMLAALVGKAMPGAMSALAGGMLGLKDSGALFVQLLESGTIRGQLVDRFDLQRVYRKRYRQDTVKKLGHRTEVTQDRKSGIITIVVTDTSRERARDMTKAYIDALDDLLIKVNTSTARREREFIEQRLVTVQSDLEKAQLALSDYASKNATLDIKEQTKAMIDASAKVEAELVVARAESDSMSQMYGEGNVRMRAANARVGELERELKKISGSQGGGQEEASGQDRLYPSLRELPIIAVRWADLYRQVKIKETVYDLLTEQYELARIEEVKSIPSVKVIDPPSWPEKKSFPPRRIIMLVFTTLAIFGSAMFLIAAERWNQVSPQDARKQLANTVWLAIKNDAKQIRHHTHGWRLSSGH
ncbi:MAG TPA: Wzz/FepE/Etk N-terminal domain-containing protein [Terriglobales bacterium]